MFDLYTYKKKHKTLTREMAKIALHDEESLNTFTFLSANVYNFLPLLPYPQHFDMFKRFRFHQWLNGLDAQFFKGKYPLKVTGWMAFEQCLRTKPGIICAYHFGSYQLINYLLIKSKMPYVLMVGPDVKERWEKLYPALLSALENAELNGRFLLLNAGDKMALRKVKGLMEKGYHLLLYVDGLEGLDEQKAEASARISFLGQRIKVPRGAAYLSHWLQVPLYPFLALRNAWRIELIKGDTIFPEVAMDRNSFIETATAKLFSFLAPYLLHWPEQWTNWPQLHRMLLDPPFIGGERWLHVDAERETDAVSYGVYRTEDAYFLLRKKDYQSFRLTPPDFDKLYNQWHMTPMT
jgi:lauroyl/myristoyl acyltransferase